MNFLTYLFLAPLAGYTDSAFRTMCRIFGASRVFTGMVSAEGLKRKNPASLELLDFTDKERPIGIQLFGSDPASFREAAMIVSERAPDFVDLNFGCSVRKIVSQGAGAALLKTPILIGEIVRAVRRATSIPVTAKIRIGFAPGKMNCSEVARALEDNGVSLISVHARFATDSLNSSPRWDTLKEVKACVSIPVIANGGVITPEDVKKILDRSNCDGLMVGRGAVGNPWIFDRTRRFVQEGILSAEPGPVERIQAIMEHFTLVEEFSPGRKGWVCFKKHLLSYLKGFEGGRRLREEASRMENLLDARAFLERTENEISRKELS